MAKEYIGCGRTKDVTVYGVYLPTCQEIVNHSPNGFNWGYHGSGPVQLALAFMVDLYGKNLKSHPIHYQTLKSELVATFPMDQDFKITDLEILQIIDKLRD